MKHRRMRGIKGVTPEYLARTDDAYRRLHLFHRSDLHGRGVRSQYNVIGNVERIAWIARRVRRRRVESVEVVVGLFNFGSFLDRVAHRDEDVFDFLPDDGQRMTMSKPPGVPGQRYIQRFTGKRFVLLALENRRLQVVERQFNSGFQFIDDTSELGTFR